MRDYREDLSIFVTEFVFSFSFVTAFLVTANEY